MQSKQEIISVEKVLAKELNLPDYQRPYKWQTTHTQQLLNDLLSHFNQGKIYQIGTIVLHNYESKKDIVDGQQRLTTLTLLLYCLNQNKRYLRLLTQDYNHTISQENIRKNYQFIQYFLAQNSSLAKDEFKKYILQKCEMVCIELQSLDEAFQFFDSQNSKGKALEPYDLLKAYHLRAMEQKDKSTIYRCVSEWENAALEHENAPNLDKIINQILFRLRAWQAGKSGEAFTSAELCIFKGVPENSDYPFMQASLASLALAKLASKSPLIFKEQFTRPAFNAYQTIFDGEYFFVYTQHYRRLYRELFNKNYGLLSKITKLNNQELGENLIEFLDTHEYSYRTGDRYLRALFECVVLAYFDRFGDEFLDRFVNKAFIWVYHMRLKWERISFKTIDNAVKDKNSLLVHLLRSPTPEFVMIASPPILETNFENVDKTIKTILEFNGAKNGED